MNVQKDAILLRELGNKLANFRRKLALAIGQKKITQIEFGEMFGGQTARQITSYERGEVDPPASMLFLIWQSGNSLDSVFSEGPVSDAGRRGALELYQKCSFVNLRGTDDATQDRILREVPSAKRLQNGSNQETPATTPGKRKASDSTPSKTKKR